MNTVYEIKCYPDSDSARIIRVTIGLQKDLFPDQPDPVTTINGVVQDIDYGHNHGYTIEVKDVDGQWANHLSAHLGYQDHLKAIAAALLRAAAFGNGGFVLDNNYLRDAS